MWFSILVAALLQGIAWASNIVVDHRTNVTYTGFTQDGADFFLNIPFGQDTGGANRFTSPQRFNFSNGTRFDNKVAGPVCPQPAVGGFDFNSNATNISEDCLNLKVIRPSFAGRESKLAVMAYIYGGSLFNGQIYERTQTGEGLVRQSVENGLPVIYVAMNYRLNIFGFALSDALKQGQNLNVGLKDQRLALEWIQNNIGEFGGDPGKVTIFGQSSGALSVTMQILAYGGSQGAPFHGAIIESTALEATSTSSITVDTFNSVARMAGCAPNGTNPQSDPTLACLRDLSMESLLAIAITQSDDVGNGDIYLPTVDGEFLPAAGSELVRTGRFTKMPVMAGWTNNDATLFTDETIETANDTRQFFESMYQALAPATINTLLSLYPISDFSPDPSANLSADFYRSARIFRDILLACPNFYFGHAMANKCTSISSSLNANFPSAYAEDASCPPVYLYIQNQTLFKPYLESTGLPGLGVIHTSEFPYVFGQFSTYNTSSSTVYPTRSDYELQARQSRAWSTFANVGQPSLRSKNTLQGWEPAYEPGAARNDSTSVVGARIYVIGGPEAGLSSLRGKGAKAAVAEENLVERCGFLNSEDVIRQLQY